MNEKANQATQITGVDLNNIKLSKYNSKWSEIFQQDKIQLQKVLRSIIPGARIEHIGSTSIPTIPKAKPVIDIAIQLFSEHEFFLNNTTEVERFLTLNGLYKKGDCKIIPKMHPIYVNKNDKVNYAHTFIHIFGSDAEYLLNSMLRFKEYLTNNPEEANKYSNIKEEILKKSKTISFGDYTLLKSQDTKIINAKALAAEYKKINDCNLNNSHYNN